MHYFDTSIILKSYVFEPRSEEAILLLDKAEAAIPISHVLEMEFNNALNLKRFRTELSDAEVAQYKEAFYSDLKSGIYFFPTVDSVAVHKRALTISNQFTPSIGARTLDILHLAYAIESKCETFNTFDSRQNQLATQLEIPSL